MKHKYLLSAIFILLASFTSLFATNFVVDGIRYSTTSDSTVQVSKNSASGAITIPVNVINNDTSYCVTSIGAFAFYVSTGLTSISIPSSVTSIGECAFCDCSGLTSITIPSSVTSIGSNAFNGCAGLTSITIPNSVTTICSTVFSGCSGLTSIMVDAGNSKYDSRENCNALIETASDSLICGCQNTIIPSSVTSIGDHAFAYCTGLASITIPSSVTSIENFAFYKCSGLTSITIPSSVASIGSTVFSGCSGLTSIMVDAGNSKYDSRENCNALIETVSDSLICGCQNTIIPSSVTSIGEYSFTGCSGLTNITIPNSVTSIGNRAFGDCSGLTSITIPSRVTSIEAFSFCNCTSLTSVSISSSVTSIKRGAFWECTGLTSITIPSSVTSIGDNAFSGCKKLRKIFNNSSLELTVGSSDYGCIAYYAKAVYNNCYVDGDFVISEDDGIKVVCDYIGADSIITIPSGVTSIGNYAFEDCTGLKSVSIPSSVTSIGNDAFEYCSSLTSITIPSGVTSIGEYSFTGCSGLTSIIIPSSVTSIGNRAFGCPSLTNVTNLATTPQTINSRCFTKKDTLHVLPGCGDVYRAAEGWKNFKVILEDAVDPTDINLSKSEGTVSPCFSIDGKSVAMPINPGIYVRNKKKIFVR